LNTGNFKIPVSILIINDNIPPPRVPLAHATSRNRRKRDKVRKDSCYAAGSGTVPRCILGRPPHTRPTL